MNTLKQISKNGLNGTDLKFLALIFMVLDHIHYFFSYTGLVPEWFSMLGRLAAPIFLFCVAEGFSHTHDRKKYFLRIWLISMGMGAVQYVMAATGLFVRPDGFVPRNAIFMNFVILIVVWQGMDWIRERKWGKGIACVVLPLAWPILAMLVISRFPALAGAAGILFYTVFPSWSVIIDGGLPYVIFGMIFYAFRQKKGVQLSLFVLYELYQYFFMVAMQLRIAPGFELSWMFTQYYEWYGAFAALPLSCYNGQRGAGHKYFFYVFYVAHVYVLYALSWLFM